MYFATGPRASSLADAEALQRRAQRYQLALSFSHTPGRAWRFKLKRYGAARGDEWGGYAGSLTEVLNAAAVMVDALT